MESKGPWRGARTFPHACTVRKWAGASVGAYLGGEGLGVPRPLPNALAPPRRPPRQHHGKGGVLFTSSKGVWACDPTPEVTHVSVKRVSTTTTTNTTTSPQTLPHTHFLSSNIYFIQGGHRRLPACHESHQRSHSEAINTCNQPQRLGER